MAENKLERGNILYRQQLKETHYILSEISYQKSVMYKKICMLLLSAD